MQSELLTFWTHQPDVWFHQAEAQFHIRRITEDETKYYYVVAALDQTTAGCLHDTLSNQLTDNKYVSLKKRLLDSFGLNKRARAAKLLHMSGLGDRKPSKLMDEMLS